MSSIHFRKSRFNVSLQDRTCQCTDIVAGSGEEHMLQHFKVHLQWFLWYCLHIVSAVWIQRWSSIIISFRQILKPHLWVSANSPIHIEVISARWSVGRSVNRVGLKVNPWSKRKTEGTHFFHLDYPLSFCLLSLLSASVALPYSRSDIDSQSHNNVELSFSIYTLYHGLKQ